METKIEKVSIKGINLKELLDKKFVEAIEKEGLELDFVNLVALVVSHEKDKIKFSPVLFSHDKREEIKDKVLHLSVEDEQNLKVVEKVFKKMIKNV